MGTMEVIRARLAAGAQPTDLINGGYSASTVYAARRSLQKQPGKVRAASTKRASNSPFAIVPTVPQALSNDPEIVSLQKRVTIAKLAKELGATQDTTLSPGAMAFYRTVRAQGFEGTVRELVDFAFATIIVDHTEMGLGRSAFEWANGVLSDQDVGNDEPVPFGYSTDFLDHIREYWESRAIPWSLGLS